MMKKLALILLLPCLLLASLAFSQTQQGYVKTKGRMEKGQLVSGQGLKGTYEAMSDLENAMSCYTKALDILNKILNKNHPYIASTYGNIANVLTKQGDFEKALEYYNTSSTPWIPICQFSAKTIPTWP